MSEAAISAGAPATGETTATQGQPGASTTTTGTAPAAPPAGSVTLTAEQTSWATNKGLNAEDLASIAGNPRLYNLATSYQSAERMIGQRAEGSIAVPGADADQAAWDQVYTRLGRPADASGYQIEIPQGQDPAYGMKAAEWFHAAGLNPQQASQIVAANNAFQAEQAAAAEQAATAAAIKQGEDISKEWGSSFTVNSEIATRGRNYMASQLGLDEAGVEAMQERLQDALGLDGALKHLKMIGDLAKTTGDSFEGAGAGDRETGGSGTTPGEAQQEIDRLLKDRAFQAKRQAGNADAVKRWDDLHRLAAKGKPPA